jgi:hypothetical protein
MDKQIQINFIKSVGIINKNILLVAILSALLICDISNTSLGLIGLQLLAFFIISPLIYGRFYESAKGESKSTWSQLFKEHWLNYTLVTLILTIPYVAINLFGISNKFAANTTLGIIINILTIYVFPLVFITRKRIFSLSSGIKCLIENPQCSIAFMLILLITATVQPFIQLYMIDPLQNTTVAFFAASFLCNMSFFYMDMLVFLAATMLLLENKNFKKYLTGPNCLNALKGKDL